MVLVCGLWSGCTKTVTNSPVYTGVVIYNVCGNVVVQSVGPDYIGQDNWVDVNNSERPVYNHIFRVSNPCQFGAYNYGDTIRFHITTPQAQRCTQCDLYLVLPDTAYPVHVEN